MKTAFTMIELIFVIVILGILAAVAIPKLSATRTDAKASVKANNIMTSAAEIATYAVAKGFVESDFTLMSNAILSMVNAGEATQDQANKTVTVKSSIGQECIDIKITSNTTDEILSIAFKTTSNDTECDIIQSLINIADYPITLRGQQVTY